VELRLIAHRNLSEDRFALGKDLALAERTIEAFRVSALEIDHVRANRAY
jgi:hypothetical protein